MTTAIFARTYAQTRREIARLLEDVALTGTVGGATSGSRVWSGDITGQRANQYQGRYIYLDGGGGAQQERAIYASGVYSPGSASFLGSIDVLQPFTTVPSTNTTFLVTERLRPSAYNDAILRRARTIALKMLIDRYDHSIVLDSRIKNGTFQFWAGGVSAAPDDWTLTGTGAAVARRTDEVYPNLPYSARVISDGTNEATLRQDVSPYAIFGGEQVEVRAVVHTTTSGRVRIQVTDGVNTFNSSYHNGQGDQELTITGQTLATTLSRLRLDLRTESGSAVTAFWKKVWLKVGDLVYEYELDANFMWVYRILAEDGGNDGIFNLEIPSYAWYINNTQDPPRLVLVPEAIDPVFGRVLRVVGQAHPAVPSAETDNLEVNPDYLTYKAAEDLLTLLPWGEQDRRNWRDKYAAVLRDAEQLERRLSARPLPGSKPARRF